MEKAFDRLTSKFQDWAYLPIIQIPLTNCIGCLAQFSHRSYSFVYYLALIWRLLRGLGGGLSI